MYLYLNLYCMYITTVFLISHWRSAWFYLTKASFNNIGDGVPPWYGARCSPLMSQQHLTDGYHFLRWSGAAGSPFYSAGKYKTLLESQWFCLDVKLCSHTFSYSRNLWIIPHFTPYVITEKSQITFRTPL